MKLQELFDVPGELNWSRLDVFEMFATEISIKWSQAQHGLEGAFSIEDNDCSTAAG